MVYQNKAAKAQRVEPKHQRRAVASKIVAAVQQTGRTVHMVTLAQMQHV